MTEYTPKVIEGWLKDFGTFFDGTTKDQGQLTINSKGLVAGRFTYSGKEEDAYTPVGSGTSEGQLTTIRGLLLAFIATHDRKWLSRATLATNGLLKYMFYKEGIPDKVDKLWVPQWLMNVNKDFATRTFHTDGQLTFSNGIAKATINNIYKIKSIRTADSSLKEPWNPDSAIEGTQLSIKDVNIDFSHLTVSLNSNYSGNALMVYIADDGPTAPVGARIEAYPVWRLLDSSETACASDSLAWAIDVFKLWYKITKDNKWLTAVDCMVTALKYECNVTNDVFYLEPSLDDTDKVVNTPVNGIYDSIGRKPVETYTYDNGFIHAYYPDMTNSSSYPGEALLGKWVGNQLPFTDDKYIELAAGSDKATNIFIYLDEVSTVTNEERWRSDIWLPAGGRDNIQVVDLKPENFYHLTNVFFGKGYMRRNDGVFYKGKATASEEDIMDTIRGLQRPVNHYEFSMEDGGWCQYMFNIWGQALPFTISYKTDDSFQYLITDSKGNLWTCDLPATKGQYNEYYMTPDMFTCSDSKADRSLLNNADYANMMLICNTQGKSSINIEYLGNKEYMKNRVCTMLAIGYSNKEECNLYIKYLKPMPQKAALPYAPYVLAQDYHIIDNAVSDNRGAPYTGYQATWLFEENDVFYDKAEAVKTNLQFVKDAQADYTKRTGITGPFTPVFWWSHSTDSQGHTPNTFDYPVGDSLWGGFQYREMRDIARLWLDNTDYAKDCAEILHPFIDFMTDYWTTLDSFPTYFPDGAKPSNNQHETQMAAVFLKCLLDLVKVDKDSSYIDKENTLIDKCFAYLDSYRLPITSNHEFMEGSFSPNPAINEWYPFWGGEILWALASYLLDNNYQPSISNDNPPLA